MDPSMINEIFTIFNVSGDGSMSKSEFSFCYSNWIEKVLFPTLTINQTDYLDC